METNPVFTNNISKGQHVYYKMAEGLGQILVALHTLLPITEMIHHLNRQSDNDRTGGI